MTLPKWGYPVALGILLLLIVVPVRSCTLAEERAQQSVIRLTEAKDSLKGLKDSLSVARADLVAARAKIDTLWRVRTVYLTSADSAKHRADSLIILASADSVARCRLVQEAYDARTSECAHLRQVVAVQDTAIRLADSTLRLTETRLTDAVSTSAALQAKLKLVSKPYTCKILFVLGCPSRTTMFILGAVGGAAGTYALIRK